MNSKIKYFVSGHERSVKAKKNILYSLILKSISIVIGLIFVPLILNYLDAERYGIWLTLSSIIAWFSFFDIGIGNGLRNRLTEAIAKKDINLARTYISTTYAILGFIFIFIIIIFLVINPFLNWQKILNTKIISNNELEIIANIVFIFFVLRFYFKIIGTILMADQRPALSNAFGPIGNVLTLIILIFLKKTTVGSLVYLSAALSIVPVVVLFFATLFFFRSDYKKFIPSIKFIDLSKSKNLLGLGVKFFFFQTASIIFFSTTNLLIAQFSDQEMVASYNVAYKYLFMINMVFGIVLTPIWSAVTDAYYRGDFKWLKNSLRKLNILSLLMICALIGALVISPYIYNIWIGSQLKIPFSLSSIIAIYLIQQIFIAPFSTFINGFGKLKLGLYSIGGQLILFIPAAYILGQKFGAIGIVSAMFLIQIPSTILSPIQVFKIINRKANGIWNK